MNATTSDTNGIASYTWSKQSGTGTITFGTGSAEDTTISASAQELYVLRLTVVDNAGNSSYDEINFTWDTTAPSVNVGSDVLANAIHAMNATTSDAFGIASYSWSKQSGAGAITFSAATSEDTNISADTSLAYVLRLTVTDNAGNSAYDELTFTWDASLPTVSIVSPANAAYCNSDNCDTVTVEGLCSEEGRNVVIGGAVSDTATCTAGEWSAIIDYSGEAEGALSITADHEDLAGNDATQASISITKDTVAPSVAAGSDLLSKVEVNLNATVSDSNGIAAYSWTKQAGAGTITFGTATAEDSTASASADAAYTLRITATDTAGNIAYDEMILTWDTTAPSVSVGSDLIVKQQYSMNATTSDTNGIASYTWSKQSGAGTITFGTGSAEDTTISANADAGYVLRLTVVDNAGNSAYDELSFTWDTTAPSVNVGSDISANASYNMTAATVSDTNGILSYSWSKESGTGSISFGAPTAKDTSISANNSEVYVLRLTVTDNAGNSAHDELSFTWDTNLPTVAISSPVNSGYCNAANCETLTVSGLCSEEGRDVVIGGTVSDTVTCTGGELSLIHI